MILSNLNGLFTHTMSVRIDDINFGNHLCHSRITNIIHNVRALYLKSHNLSESDCFGHALIVMHLNIAYLSQSIFDDKLIINLYNECIEKATVKFSYAIHNETSGKLAATATTLLGFLDLAKKRLRRVPIEFSNFIIASQNNNQE